jgi:predicted phage replisome organizer
MAEVLWIKFYIDMFDKRKINKIRRLPDGDRILLFWVMLLATAGKCNAGGMIFITEKVPFTVEDLADEFDFEPSLITLALNAFVEYDMIELYDDGFIAISNWEHYQNTDRLAEIREYNRLAKQKSREKKKLLEGVKDNVNDKSMTSQRCQDIEEEKEEDKEKEFHSFNRSYAHEENISKDLEYVERKVEEAGFEYEEDAAVYRAEVIENLKLRYVGGTLGQGVVFMSNEQLSDLIDKIGLDAVEKYMGIVAECEKSGKRYKKKSHYQAILDMAARDRRIGK